MHRRAKTRRFRVGDSGVSRHGIRFAHHEHRVELGSLQIELDAANFHGPTQCDGSRAKKTSPRSRVDRRDEGLSARHSVLHRPYIKGRGAEALLASELHGSAILERALQRLAINELQRRRLIEATLQDGFSLYGDGHFGGGL